MDTKKRHYRYEVRTCMGDLISSRRTEAAAIRAARVEARDNGLDPDDANDPGCSDDGWPTILDRATLYSVRW